MPVQEQVAAITRDFLDGLKRVLGRKLHGAYIYGAAAFPDTEVLGDIDFHVILDAGLTDEERAALEALHGSLAAKHPPLGGEMDGYYILLEDARGDSPPKSQMWDCATDDSWALHREHIRAGRCIVLHGPDPKEIYRPASWPEIEGALLGELDYVEEHLDEHPGYGILNLCRLIYSFETRDVVVSKAQAAAWACEALPEWKPHIELARKSYAGLATSEETRWMLEALVLLFKLARERISRTCEGGGPPPQ
jgi:hypothetical protein